MAEELTFKAHARLLTMLGEQLIKNERIALVELVKNAYDADATKVTVDFQGFGPELEKLTDSQIVITDNGVGMSLDTVRFTWMNPATPAKAISKAESPKTPRGRVLQGEKGIGRFATFKLGNQVALVTRTEDSQSEITLLVDISGLDEAEESSTHRVDYFLEDVAALLDVGPPVVFNARNPVGSHQGTQLEIRGLRADWNRELVVSAFADLDRLQPQLWPSAQGGTKSDFTVTFLADGEDLDLGAARTEHFEAILERAVLRVTNGQFNQSELRFEFNVNGRYYQLPLDDSEIAGLKVFRDHFRNKDGTWSIPACGSFGFEFFVFDFTPTAPAEYHLDSEDKDELKLHRIYLYRDGIRVYPYGDPKDDWLEIDAIRGTQSARSMFSNNQSVGFVSITQEDNPHLRDKTNREGLLDWGRDTRDFVVLIQSVLSYLRSKPYEQYAAANRRVREKELKSHRLDKHIESLRNDFELPKKALALLDSLEESLSAEREVASIRVARTEELAGVGLSVETASHDLIAAGGEALRLARQIVQELRLQELMEEPVFALASSLVVRLEFINSRFKDVQGLFVSSRQKRKSIDVLQLTKRVRSMYSGLHKEEEIEFEVDESSAIKAMSTEGSVLQCVINLVDNATFWLMDSHRPRLIRAFALDDRSLVVTDNGPGVKELDEPFIFDAFYSGKGDDGKGLGLYIARENGLRNGFSVDLEAVQDPRALPGATFVVRFAEAGG